MEREITPFLESQVSLNRGRIPTLPVPVHVTFEQQLLGSYLAEKDYLSALHETEKLKEPLFKARAYLTIGRSKILAGTNAEQELKLARSNAFEHASPAISKVLSYRRSETITEAFDMVMETARMYLEVNSSSIDDALEDSLNLTNQLVFTKEQAEVEISQSRGNPGPYSEKLRDGIITKFRHLGKITDLLLEYPEFNHENYSPEKFVEEMESLVEEHELTNANDLINLSRLYALLGNIEGVEKTNNRLIIEKRRTNRRDESTDGDRFHEIQSTTTLAAARTRMALATSNKTPDSDEILLILQNGNLELIKALGYSGMLKPEQFSHLPGVTPDFELAFLEGFSERLESREQELRVLRQLLDARRQDIIREQSSNVDHTGK